MRRSAVFYLLLSPFLLLAQQPVMENLGNWLEPGQLPQGSMQGMAVYRHYAITLRHGGQCCILDLKHKSCAAIYPLEGNTSHCNNASWGRKLSPSDPFPLLYVSSCFGDKACHVTHITLEGANTVQKIFYDSDCFKVAQDWCVDADEGFIYAFGGKKGGMMYLKQFPLPNLDRTEVHFTDADVLQTIPISCVKVAQGSKIKSGYAYLPDGDEPGNYYLHIINLATGQEVRTIDLNPIGLEPEGIDIVGRWIYISFNSPEPNDNAIIRFRRPLFL